MSNFDDPAQLPPDERLAEIASLLAMGILRLRRRFALPGKTGQKISPESAPEGLEVPDETRLSVCAG